MKKLIKTIACLTLGVSLSLTTAACGESESQSNGISATVRVTEFTNPVPLVHYNVLAYLQANPDTLVTDFLNPSVRIDKGCPVEIEYTVDSEQEYSIESATVDVSPNADFSVIEQTDELFGMRESVANIYNLKTGVKYYFRVTVQLESGQRLTGTGSFETMPSPRFINLDGACNVRDIGGWITESGKTIKQGLLYRGSEIDGGKNVGHPDFCLTETGVKQLRSFGIKTDLDLRSEEAKNSEYSILGENVTRNFYNAYQYQSVFTANAKETTRKIFSDLAKPEAYPVYLHCTHGVDRAGTTSLLLEALLGVKKEDLIRDYELSAFYHNYAHVTRNLDNGGTILKLIEGLEAFEGETLADKTEAFMLSIGVTQAEIDSIRSIFLA